MDTLIKEEEAARMLGVTTSKLQQDRWKNTGLQYIKLGKSVRYSLQVIEAFVAANTVIPTH